MAEMPVQICDRCLAAIDEAPGERAFAIKFGGPRADLRHTPLRHLCESCARKLVDRLGLEPVKSMRRRART